MYRLTVLFLLVMALLFPSTASAIDFTLSTDRVNPGDTIIVTGHAESSSWVSIKGIDSFGNIIYFDSLKTDNLGTFSKNVLIPNNTGNYVNFVVGSASETQKKEVRVNRTGSSGGGGVGTNSNQAPSTFNMLDVKNSTIVVNEDGRKTQLFTVGLDALEIIQKAKESGCKSVILNFQSTDKTTYDSTIINISKDLILKAKDLGITINTANVKIELDKDIVNTLTNGNKDTVITISKYNHSFVQEQMSDIPGIENSQIIGDPLEIKTEIVGASVVTIPINISGLNYSQDDVAQLIKNIRIFVIHSDGKKEVLTGDIVYDPNSNPVAVTFQVNRYSVFSVVCLMTKEIIMTIDKSEVSINGKSYFWDARPYIDKSVNRTMAPLRFIGEALDAKVHWDENKNSVTINDGENSLVLTIGEKEIYINNDRKEMELPARVISGRTYIPVRYIAEALKANVKYVPGKEQVVIYR